MKPSKSKCSKRQPMRKARGLSRILCILVAMCISLTTYAQSIVVGGKIFSSSDGEPLVGATVHIQGSTKGTVTDIDGLYQLQVIPGDVLVFSYIGFKSKEITIVNQSQLDVALEADSQELSEVVVTAFGIERERKALGYSAQGVSSEALTEAREANVVNSLKGRIAGLHVNPSSGGAGGSSNVVIRGASSLTGSNQPLYVLDGVPIDNSTLDAANLSDGRDFGDGIGNINPDDVESMTVLKGPSAAALYGARGANGVILITTKKGTGRKGIGVELNSNFTLESPNVLPIVQNKWGGGYGGNYSSFGTTEIDGVEYPVYTNSMYDHWGGEMDGRLIVVAHMPELGVIPYSPQPAGNIRDFYRTGSTATNTVAITGGGEKSSVRVSLSDMRNKHILPTTSFSRQTIAVNFSSKITERLTLEGRVNYVRQAGENRPELGFGGGSANVANSLAQLARFVDLDWLKNYKRPDGTMVNYQQRTPHNPYWIANELLSEDKRDRVMGYMTARYKLTDWLTLQARSGTDFYKDVRFTRTGIGTTGASTIRGNLNNTQWAVREDNHDILLMINKDLSSDFSLSMSLGANHLNRHNEVIGVRGDNLIVDDLYHISNARNVVPRHSITRKQMNSVFGQAQIGYKNGLFLDLTGRNDWSSTLGRDHYSFFYPSASLSFVLTDFIDANPRFLSFGKLRASVASAGNDANPYLTKSGYSIASTEFNGQRFSTLSNRIPLLDLRNELTTSTEFGADLRFFQSRLGFDLTYYNSSTKNQIVPLPISQSSGYRDRMINAGEIQNKGFEALVTLGLIKNTAGFSWEMIVNMSRNKSQVVSLADGVESLSLLNHTYASIEARPGQPYGNIVGFKYLRAEDGQLLLTSQGKLQRTTTREILGNIQPDFLGGLTNTFSYKTVTLSALIDVRKGGQIFSHTKYRQMANGTGYFTLHREPEMIIEGVIRNEDGTYSPNTHTVDPQNYYAPRAWSNMGEEFVIDADYVAFRELTLGYALPGRLVAKTPFTAAKLSVVGRNLFYIYRDPEFKAMGLAPESAFNNSSAAQGLETMSLPTTRSLGVNLSISF